MSKKLLEYQADELLEKFGMGLPTPGSGSAAAFQVLLSAHLIKTVVILTDKDKRKPEYENWLPELRRIKAEIETRICPSLRNYSSKIQMNSTSTFDYASNMNVKKANKGNWR
jgi:formiminotetrahydrofolate cyclodeaminase